MTLYNGKKRKQKRSREKRAVKRLGELRGERDRIAAAAEKGDISKADRLKLYRLSKIIFASEKAVLVTFLSGEEKYKELAGRYSHATLYEAFKNATRVLSKEKGAA